MLTFEAELAWHWQKDFSLKAMENSVSQLLQPQGFLAVTDSPRSSQEAFMCVCTPLFLRRAFGAGPAASQGSLSYVGSKGFHSNRTGEKNANPEVIFF